MLKRRCVPVFLALTMLFTLLCAPTALAATSTYNGRSYDTDYTKWRQGDSAWGSTALGDLHNMRDHGCLVSSVSILMCHSGAYDPALLNPGSFRDFLDTIGGISHSSDRSQDGLMNYGAMTRYTSPRFYYVDQEKFDVSTPISTVVQKLNTRFFQGYFAVARVKNSGHFVAVARTAGNDAILYDPGANSKKLLSEYNGTIGGLIYFKANLNAKDPIFPNASVSPGKPAVTGLASTYGDGDRVKILWNSTTHTTHYNVYIDRQTVEGWQQFYRKYDYATSPLQMAALPAGTYRARVQSANANSPGGWTYANSDYKTFTIKANSITVNYNPNGGSVSPANQLVSKDSTYDLPTPKRTNAAFLGWYTNNGGELVTNTTKMKTTMDHILVARWDTGGQSILKTLTYQNNFRDISRSSWYYDNVTAVYCYGLMNGSEPGKFMPNARVSAAETITMAARLRKLYTAGSRTFPTTTPWYKAYTDYALSQNIISAVPSDLNGALTRQEFASILAKALPDAALPAVNDVPNGSIPDVYRSDTGIYKLYRAGILSGNDPSGTFLPNAPITRAEVAAVLVRMADPNSRILFSLN